MQWMWRETLWRRLRSPITRPAVDADNVGGIRKRGRYHLGCCVYIVQENGLRPGNQMWSSAPGPCTLVLSNNHPGYFKKHAFIKGATCQRWMGNMKRLLLILRATKHATSTE